MVTLIRSADLNGVDKQLKAREWAKKATHYVSGRFGFSTVECGVEVYGNAGRFTWIGRQESLESLARGTMESLADEGYQRLLLEGADLFVFGSIRDTVIVGI